MDIKSFKTFLNKRNFKKSKGFLAIKKHPPPLWCGSTFGGPVREGGGGELVTGCRRGWWWREPNCCSRWWEEFFSPYSDTRQEWYIHLHTAWDSVYQLKQCVCFSVWTISEEGLLCEVGGTHWAPAQEYHPSRRGGGGGGWHILL